jgi:ABC-type glycerol-3-phosphate transport system substrate-binding protein
MVLVCATIVTLAVVTTIHAQESPETPMSGIRVILDSPRFYANKSEWTAEFKRISGANIEITVPSHGEYSIALGTIIRSGRAADICQISSLDLEHYIESGDVIALDTFIQSSPFLKDISPENRTPTA